VGRSIAAPRRPPGDAADRAPPGRKPSACTRSPHPSTRSFAAPPWPPPAGPPARPPPRPSPCGPCRKPPCSGSTTTPPPSRRLATGRPCSSSPSSRGRVMPTIWRAGRSSGPTSSGGSPGAARPGSSAGSAWTAAVRPWRPTPASRRCVAEPACSSSTTPTPSTPAGSSRSCPGRRASTTASHRITSPNSPHCRPARSRSGRSSSPCGSTRRGPKAPPAPATRD
jgi:hypothetical protein